jgi:hypothetical protein
MPVPTNHKDETMDHMQNQLKQQQMKITGLEAGLKTMDDKMDGMKNELKEGFHQIETSLSVALNPRKGGYQHPANNFLRICKKSFEKSQYHLGLIQFLKVLEYGDFFHFECKIFHLDFELLF